MAYAAKQPLSGQQLRESSPFMLSAGGASRGKSTRSFALSVFNLLKAKRDQWFPSASPQRARLKAHTV